MTTRTELFRLNGAVERDPAINGWMKEHASELGVIAQKWFEVMRKCGDEVRELLHDGCPTACLGDAAFGYVNVFTSHVNVGFFQGVSLPDPNALTAWRYHAGLPSGKRKVRVSPPLTISRARIRSAPSCLTLEPLTSIASSVLKTIPIWSRKLLGQRKI